MAVELKFKGDTKQFVEGVHLAAKATLNLRKEIKVLKDGIAQLAAQGASKKTIEPLTQELIRAQKQMQDLTGTGNKLFSSFEKGFTNSILKIGTATAILGGFKKVLSAAVDNSEDLKKKLESVDTAAEGAAGALGDMISEMDDFFGVTERVNKELNKTANIIRDGSFLQRAGLLFGIRVGDDSPGYDAKGTKDAQKDARRKTLQILEDELERLRDIGKHYDMLAKQEQAAADAINERGQEGLELFMMRKAAIDEMAESLETAFPHTPEGLRSSDFIQGLADAQTQSEANIEMRQAIAQWELERENERAQISKDASEEARDNFIRGAKIFESIFTAAIFKGGDALNRTIETILAKLASAGGIALLGTLFNMGSFGNLFGKILGFADGGFTGAGIYSDPSRPGHRVAGVVHDNEYVAPRHVVSDPLGSYYVSQLETIRRQKGGFAGGGMTTGSSFSPAIRNEVIVYLDGEQVYTSVERNGRRKFESRS